MPANYLDADQALVEQDPATGELKATTYFEDYLYQIISTIGGEGSTLVSDLESVSLEAGKLHYYTGLIKQIQKQISEIKSDSYSEILLGLVKQLQIDTQGFNGRVETYSYTAVDKDWVEGRSNAIIYLPANALVNTQVIVCNGDGTRIKVHGNGHDIKYKSTDTIMEITRQGTSLLFQMFKYGTTKYWRVR